MLFEQRTKASEAETQSDPEAEEDTGLDEKESQDDSNAQRSSSYLSVGEVSVFSDVLTLLLDYLEILVKHEALVDPALHKADRRIFSLCLTQLQNALLALCDSDPQAVEKHNVSRFLLHSLMHLLVSSPNLCHHVAFS